MASLKEIRARIKSAKNIQQITKAMKMVAAARLRRSQQAILETRPYAIKIGQFIGDIAAGQRGDLHPLLKTRPGAEDQTGPLNLVVVAADKGLCGSFNVQVIRRAVQIIRANADKREVSLTVVGRKPRDFFRRLEVAMASEHINIFNNLKYAHADVIGKQLIKDYLEGSYDEVVMLFTEFVSAMTLPVREQRLLPFAAANVMQEEDAIAPGGLAEFSFEPDQEQILAELLPRAVKMMVWRGLLESRASEFAARMTAMDSATRNSKEMINNLTLTANRIRQAVITREIAELVGGAAALE